MESDTRSKLSAVREELVIPENGMEHLVYERVNFTKEQRKWILRRDDFQCQHPTDHEHQGNLQVHHLVAQMFAQAFLGLDEEMINMAENGITLCEGIHVGVDLRKPLHPDTLHPDHFEARKKYAQDKYSFFKVGEEHRKKARNGEKYWNSKNDDILLFRAIFRTRQEEKRYNHPYPVHTNGKRR